MLAFLAYSKQIILSTSALLTLSIDHLTVEAVVHITSESSQFTEGPGVVYNDRHDSVGSRKIELIVMMPASESRTFGAELTQA